MNALMAALLFLTPALVARPGIVGADVNAAFRKLLSLAGDWTGTDEKGRPAKTSFKVIVSETALMETLDPPGMDEMVTIYSVDGNTISLMHYCPTGNQPRMRANPPPGKVTELSFSFLDARNLPAPDVGHEHRLVIHFRDRDHITETWVWRENGRDSPQVFHFTRKTR